MENTYLMFYLCFGAGVAYHELSKLIAYINDEPQLSMMGHEFTPVGLVFSAVALVLAVLAIVAIWPWFLFRAARS